MGSDGPVTLKAGKEGHTIFQRALGSAIEGGITGAAAQAVNVITLMWLRTVMNVQMANGGSMMGTIKLLYKEGGVPRFYRGLVPALIGSPLSRFGDTFANAGALAATEHIDAPIFVKTALASVSAGGMRIFLLPIDAWKTNKQVHGKSGLQGLLDKARQVPNRSIANLYGWNVLWHGALASATATAVGHWPWFGTCCRCTSRCVSGLRWASCHSRHLSQPGWSTCAPWLSQARSRDVLHVFASICSAASVSMLIVLFRL